MNKGAVYIGRFEFPDCNAAATRVRMISKLLKKSSYDCTFITTYNTINKEPSIVEGCKVYYSSSKGKTNYYSKDYIRLIEQIDNVSIIIVYNLPSNILFSINQYSKKKKITIIGDVTEWYGSSDYSGLKRLLKQIDTIYRMRVLHKQLDGLILISSYLKKYYRKTNNIVLPPLLDIEWKTDELDKWIDEGIVSFVYAGNPGKEKDKINLVINAFQKLEGLYDFKFNIYGITKENFEIFYPELKEYLFKSSNITFHGRVHRNVVIQATKNSDYFIFVRGATRANMAGFPTKFVESLSLGTPVITNITSDIGNYLTDGENGYIIKELSIEGVYTILEKILKNNTRIKLKNSHKNAFYFEKYHKDFDLFMSSVSNKKNR
jgi:glycosyltransferase involved in cell wall biosynthesis